MITTETSPTLKNMKGLTMPSHAEFQQLGAEPLKLCHYFLTRFGLIHDYEWCAEQFSDGRGCRCVFGHLGMEKFSQPTTEAEWLIELFTPWNAIYQEDEPMDIIWKICDGKAKYNKDFPQTNPKGRIMAMLKKREAELIEESAFCAAVITNEITDPTTA